MGKFEIFVANPLLELGLLSSGRPAWRVFFVDTCGAEGVWGGLETDPGSAKPIESPPGSGSDRSCLIFNPIITRRKHS